MPTWAGVAYVCFITDVYSRMIVGWRVASHMRTDMVLDAIEMARWNRGLHHTGLHCLVFKRRIGPRFERRRQRTSSSLLTAMTRSASGGSPPGSPCVASDRRRHSDRPLCRHAPQPSSIDSTTCGIGDSGLAEEVRTDLVAPIDGAGKLLCQELTDP